MFRMVLVSFCLGGILLLTGCPSNSMKDAVELTVGGESATAALQAEGIQWYAVALEASKEYAFILKTDEIRTSVGVIFSVYLVEDDVQSLMWQRHYDPDEFVQFSNENDCCCGCEDYPMYYEKQLAVDKFLAPKTGEYYISIEGYVNTEGNDQVNSYAYSDTLVYSVAVKYAYTPFNPQGADIPAKAQAAAVPFVNTLIEVYETVYHRVALKQGGIYQVQKRRSDDVTGPVWMDQYGTPLSDAMYFVAPYDGTFLLKIDGPGGVFGYSEYGLRVQQDDHSAIPTLGTATKIAIGGSAQGYLGEQDTDVFYVTLPAMPLEQVIPKRYHVSITDSNRFWLTGAGLVQETDTAGKPLQSYIVTQGLVELNVYFSPVTKDAFTWLNTEPDGAGAYKITVEELPEETAP